MSKRETITDKERWEAEQTLKEEMRGLIGKPKEYKKKLANKKLCPAPIHNPLAQKTVKRIQTGTALDRIFSKKGGIEVGSTVEFYGEFASGKTQVCLALTAEAIKRGLAIFIDGEWTFRSDRFREICEERGVDVEECGDRLLLWKPKDWIDQEAITMHLPEFDENDNFERIEIIVVDSLMRHWAAAPEFYGRDKLTYRQQLVRAQVDRLANYARRHGAVLVYTNQIYDKPVDTTFAPPESKVGSRGGRTVEHLGDIRIFLRKGRGNVRFARLVDNLELPLLEVPFILDASGIRDIPSPAERAKAVVIGERYALKFTSGQVTSAAAGKEYKMKALELGYITEEEAEGLGLTDKDIKKALNAQAKTMEDRMGELTTEELEILEVQKKTSEEGKESET